MATIDEIKQQAEAVKNATQVGENTAERVGGALAGLADIAKQQETELAELGYYQEDNTYIRVFTDSENKILFGIKNDGSVDWAIGVPTPIQKEINNVLFKTLNLSDSVNGLSDLVEHINNSYQTKEEGKSLVKNEYHLSVDSDDYIYAITDTEGKILFGLKKDGNIEVGKNRLNQVSKVDGYRYAITDNENKVILGIDDRGNLICPSLNKYIDGKLELYSQQEYYNAFIRNRYKENMLCATAKSGWKHGENFQALLVGDPHASKIAIGNAITMTNGFNTIDAVIVLGDIEMFAPRQMYATFDLKWVNDTFSNKCYKKWYLVCGNHDVGADNIIHFTRTHEEVYNDMVLPMIENGCLTEGEYGTSANYSDRCYYFHDFHEKKVRLISLYEYDMPLELEDSNEYWEYVPYNSSYPLMEQAKEYVYDEANPTILNCGGYKSHSFKLKKTVKTVANASDDVLSTTMPRYKCRSVRVLSLNQINWLANVLNTTPNGYGIIIATHQPVMRNVVLTENKFSQDESFNGYNPRKNEPAYDDNADCDIITEIINAWINKTHIIKKVSYKDTFYTTESTGGTVEYVNKLTDSDGNKYAYEVNIDFSTRTNNSSYFSCFISGHEHWDMIEYKSVYPNIYNIICPTANPKFRTGGDNPIVIKEDSVAFDCINVLSCEYGKIGLVRLGCDKTITGKDRDFEIINTIK